MPRRFPLQSLLDLAQDRVDSATQQLALLKQRWQSQEGKLQQLHGYQEEYRVRLSDTLKAGTDMTRIQDFQAFLKKLEIAIKQQTLEVNRAKFEWEQGQAVWQEEQRKLKTYDILRQRHERGEAYKESRIEQRDMDEFARNSARRKQESED